MNAEELERHRRELHVHCYRMLGSYHEAEDLVQETFLRAWRKRDEPPDNLKAWLYKIATNACLDFLRANPRRPEPLDTPMAADAGMAWPVSTHVSWISPYPDDLLDSVIERETIELAFLVAIQHLPAKQRAIVILRDVLGWSAPETAAALDTTVTAVKSALQRARPVLREHLPAQRMSSGSADELAVVRAYIHALEQGDPSVLPALLASDVWQTMPPTPGWILGREAFVSSWGPQMSGEASWGDWRVLPARVNRQPAIAAYLRRPGEEVFSASWLGVFRMEGPLISEITTFDHEFFPQMGLPDSFSGDASSYGHD
ncbi:RNA polymerase subunit sigma-70 [Nonomuraea sp. NPDC059007]|uniref:RNA polymerase subunit sigma-70 n=1 Tax=Nonomuraea sp. NPDC059007 TaxID=3346692 RepID=UPI00367AB3BA